MIKCRKIQYHTWKSFTQPNIIYIQLRVNQSVSQAVRFGNKDDDKRRSSSHHVRLGHCTKKISIAFVQQHYNKVAPIGLINAVCLLDVRLINSK